MTDDDLFTPEFALGHWLNTPHPLTLADLRGAPVLIDFWDYTCVNCLRALPYINAWHWRYADFGLQVIGVHAPAFTFGREQAQVQAALDELDIRYPVLLDNDFATWHNFDNHYWPARYLLDKEGRLRHQQSGEGGYAVMEQVIQRTLRECDADASLPPVMAPLRPEDAPEARMHRATPELRGGLHRGALGNPEGYAATAPMLYSLPQDRRPGAFYIGGAWQADQQHISYQGRGEGIVHVPYTAAEVNAVLSPQADAVERIIHPQTIDIEIWQDDRPLPAERRGYDVDYDGRLTVSRPRMYNLIRNPGHEQHELTLRVRAPGFAVYAFSFIGTVQD